MHWNTWKINKYDNVSEKSEFIFSIDHARNLITDLLNGNKIISALHKTIFKSSFDEELLYVIIVFLVTLTLSGSRHW